MDQTLFIGYLVLAVITLGSFIGIVLKFTQPINDLRIVIQELKDTLNNMKLNDDRRDKHLEKHDRDIQNLENRVGNLETRMNIYHSNREE